MRIVDIINEDIDESNNLGSALVNILYLLNNKADDDSVNKVVSFASVQQLLSNNGFDIDYDGFVELYNTTPAISNLISSFSGSEIKFASGDIDEPTVQGNDMTSSEDHVGDMAKRAMKKRI